MWDSCKAKLGKVCDGVTKILWEFGNFESDVKTTRVTNAQNLMFQSGATLRQCTQVSSCECVEWTASLGHQLVSPWPLRWTGRRRVWWLREESKTTGFAGLCPLQVQLKVRGPSQTFLCVSEPQLVHFDTADCRYTGGLVDSDFAFAEFNGICTEGELPVHRELWHERVVKLHGGSPSWWRCRV